MHFVFTLFALMASCSLASAADAPLFAMNPSLKLRVLATSQDQHWLLQNGKRFASKSAIDPQKPHCQITFYRFSPIAGDVFRVRNIDGAKRYLERGKTVRQAFWENVIYAGTQYQIDLYMRCAPGRSQQEELTVGQLAATLKGHLELFDVELVDYDTRETGTLAEIPAGAKLRFNRDVKSMTRDRHLLFQNGRPTRPWEAGPQCHVRALSADFEIKAGSEFAIKNLRLAYTHTIGLKTNTSSFIEAEFEGHKHAYMFNCSNNSNAFKLPTRDDFRAAVGDYVSVTTR